MLKKIGNLEKVRPLQQMLIGGMKRKERFSCCGPEQHAVTAIRLEKRIQLRKMAVDPPGVGYSQPLGISAVGEGGPKAKQPSQPIPPEIGAVCDESGSA